MLSERSQSRKDNSVCLRLEEAPRALRFLETERGGVARGSGRGSRELTHDGKEFQLCKMDEFWRLAAKDVNILNSAELYTLKWLRWSILCYRFLTTMFKEPPYKLWYLC